MNKDPVRALVSRFNRRVMQFNSPVSSLFSKRGREKDIRFMD